MPNPDPSMRVPATVAPRFNKFVFFRDMGYSPHAGQRLVHKSQARFRVMACGVRWGKTTAAAMEGIAAAMQPAERSVGWICGPTYDLAQRAFREIEVIVLEHLRPWFVKKSDAEHKIVLRNLGGGLSEIRAKSADNPVSLLGEGLNWLIVDEASRMKPAIWQSHLSQRLVDKKGWAFLISTPRGKRLFYEMFRRGQGEHRDPDWESWNLPSWNNPMLDQAVIDAERERLPARVFAQEYGAQFVEGAGSVFRNVRECATGEFVEPLRGWRYYAGLDLAKVEDFTVLVIVNHLRDVVFVDRFHRLDWALQISRVRGALDRYNHADVLVDSTGVGEPIYDLLRREGVRATAYPFTTKSKSALIENLSLLLEQQKLVLPRAQLWPEGIEELEAYEYSISEAGNTSMSAPSGQHDDCVVATALAAWQVRESRPQYRISVIGRRRWR